MAALREGIRERRGSELLARFSEPETLKTKNMRKQFNVIDNYEGVIAKYLNFLALNFFCDK